MKSSRIIIDIGSGDHAPHAPLKAVLASKRLLAKHQVVLIGCLSAAEQALLPSSYQYLQADDIVTMKDSPAQALRKGKRTSMWQAFELLADDQDIASVAVSAGNTGAMIALAKHIIGMNSDSLKRPALMSRMPNCDFYCADLGANLTLSAEQMVELARFCVQQINGKETRVALLNVASEAEKGPVYLKEAHALLQNMSDELSFIGFIEPHDIFKCEGLDLVIADGLMGNIMLKSFEGAFEYASHGIVGQVSKSLWGRLALWRNSTLDVYFQKHLQHQTASLVGLNQPVLKVHGRADVSAFAQSLRVAIDSLKERKQCASAALQD